MKVGVIHIDKMKEYESGYCLILMKLKGLNMYISL